MRRFSAAFAALLWFGTPLAAAAPDTSAPIVAAQPTLVVIPLTIASSNGARRFRVEVAATPREQQIGMMFRTRMARGTGMLFPFTVPQRLSFWMENTVLPLDLVFIAADARILSIAADAKPYSRDFIPSQGIAAAVLEIGAGEAIRLGLQPGDRVEYRLPPAIRAGATALPTRKRQRPAASNGLPSPP